MRDAYRTHVSLVLKFLAYKIKGNMDSKAIVPMSEHELHHFLDCNLQHITFVFCAAFHSF